MIVLFIHKGFPGQFKYLAPILAQDTNNVVLYITADKEIPSIPNVNKLVYEPEKLPQGFINPALKNYETALAHSKSVAKMCLMMKQKGIIPDIVISHNSGCSMFVKDIFPNTPILSYLEWFDNAQCPAIRFDGTEPDENYKEQIRSSANSQLVELNAMDAGISPTNWQLKQFPEIYHSKTRVIHDGVDTDVCKPEENAIFEIDGQKFSAKNEVITYATRGMEPMRGFPQFMQAAEKLLKIRPNAHVIVAGLDKVCYGKPLKQGTYKQLMLNKLNIDKSRLHFVGGLDFGDYLKLLQISSAHVYATFPFILSWSFMEAMATAVPIIASSTEPVCEIMQDGVNGLLYDFFDIDMLVEKIEFALDNKLKMVLIRENARKTILEKYDLKNMLVQQIIYIQEIVANLTKSDK